MKQNKNRSTESGKYPIGTLAAYGPDNTQATKLVASVFVSPQQTEPDALERWIVTGGDIRQVPDITAEVEEFFKRHRVKESVASEKMMGCPHEEGIDYPLGRVCPHCPFWEGLDRMTLEPVVLPAPTRSPEQILEELAQTGDHQPLAALASADAHREALTEPLLQVIERGLGDPEGLPEGEATLFSYATYLFAKWRETRAYPLFVRWLSLPGEEAFAIGGDTVTQDGNRFLAAVFDGDWEPIKGLILNREANEFCRGQAVSSLALLAVWAEVPRDEAEAYYSWLADEGLEREGSFVWAELASSCADMEALTVFPALRKAYESKFIDPTIMDPSELDDVEAGPRGKWIEEQRAWHPPIDDVAEATAWWQCFSDERGKRARLLAEMQQSATIAPYQAAPKIGRNDPCTCGSGKKYKKCCGK